MEEHSPSATAGPLAAPTFTNLADLVAHQAATRPEAIALVEPGPARRVTTWAVLDARVSQYAQGLAANGLVAGHRVGLLGPNTSDWIVAYLAILRAGYVSVPINPQLTSAELAAIVVDSGLRVLLAAGRNDLGRLPDAVRVLPLTASALVRPATPGTALVASPRDPEQLAALLYTAGTSGRPKAAMLSHRALLAHLDHLATLGVITADTVVLGALPLFHVFGLNAVLGSWLRAGARLVVVDGADAVFDVVVAEEVDNLPLAPAVLPRLLADPRSSTGLRGVRTLLSGAAPLSVELAETFTARTGIRVDQGYGLTEAAPGISVTLGGALLGHGHVGRALPGVEVRIGDGSDPTEPGEIWVRGDNLFSGYWPDGSGGPDADGWFATGDIGYLEAGELFLVDRARELVIVNGFNVYPGEVEEVIAALPGVQAVAVVGRPDPRTGEQVVAFVVAPDLDEAAVAAHCVTRLAKFKRPGLIRLVDVLPRGATGKVQKGRLRAVAGAESATVGEPTSDGPR